MSSPRDAPVAVISGGVVGAAVTHALARRGVAASLLEPERDDAWRKSEHQAWRAFVDAAASLGPG